MLFNSLGYWVFLPVVFLLYWFVFKRLSQQNLLLLVASYFFYACWDYRFLGLLFFSTLLDYYTGIRISTAGSVFYKRLWLWTSILINVGFLCFFKYYNFFIESAISGLTAIGFKQHLSTLHIILPVGISFYTFHGLSYIFDIYNRKIQPNRNFIEYGVFVSFFPLLIAGPIERATHLLPQIVNPRQFSYEKAITGLRQILWGMFKKVVIADSIAPFISPAFANPDGAGGSTLVLSAVLFAIQIYADFSGYSDIALGSAKLLGIDLIRNFNFPYFSRNLGEFWRRWHISLSTWFNDYLFTPLTIRWRYWGIGGIALAIICTFLVSGLWHGAAWTFIFWGFLHGAGLSYELLTRKWRKQLFKIMNAGLVAFIGGIATFSFVTFALIFFRARSFHISLHFIRNIFSRSLLTMPARIPADLLFCLFIFIVIEIAGKAFTFPFERLPRPWPRPFKWVVYGLFLFAVLMYSGQNQQFIYFQF